MRKVDVVDIGKLAEQNNKLHKGDEPKALYLFKKRYTDRWIVFQAKIAEIWPRADGSGHYCIETPTTWPSTAFFSRRKFDIDLERGTTVWIQGQMSEPMPTGIMVSNCRFIKHP